MKIIVCIDEKGGMAFNGRRLSRDRFLCKRIIELTGENRLLMNGYSKELFGEQSQITVDENFLDIAAGGDFCFVENTDVAPFESKAEGIIVYNWNRRYSSDLKFGIDLSCGWKLVSTADFKGSSHEKITEEIFERIV